MFDEEGQYYNKHRNVMGANHAVGGLYENAKERGTFRLIDNIQGTYRFNDKFAISSAWSFDFYQMHDYLYWNGRYGDGRNSGGASNEAKSETVTWQGTQSATYTDVFSGVHNVDAVAGYEASQNDRSWNEIYGEGFAHPDLQYVTSAAITEGSGGRNEYSFQSYFSRLNYDYDRTYFLSASYRRDGSSRFGPDQRYGNFWSLGAGYNLSHASFMEALSVVDYLKIRGSYGSIGNASIGNYEWQGLYGFGAAYDNEPGSAPSQVANRLLTWESQAAFNVGVDYALFDSKVTGTIEYYRKNSSDLLLDVPTSLTTGFGSTLQNFGDMENWGWEFAVQADLLREQDYDLNVNFNFTSQNNKITKLSEAYIDGTKRREEGRDFQEYYLYGWAGVNPDDGGATYYTDETKTATEGRARTRFYDGKSATPDYIGSFGFTGRYKRWTLSTQANYVLGHYLYEGAERFYHGDGRYLPRSTSQWAWLNRWQQPGDDALFPRQEWGGVSNSQPSNSDRWLHQGDFIRFRNLTLAYRIPESWANSLRLSSLDAQINLNNFYTWVADENLHFDPEQQFTGVYNTGTPNSKTLSFGLTMGF
jgi:TonB-linked SusC/RagA family outer membrane protein